MDKELLQRYVEGNVTMEEIETVVEWLDESEENVREFMALHKLYDISLFNKPALQNTVSKNRRTIPYRRITFELLKIAAVFLITWNGIQFLLNKPEQNVQTAYQTFYVPAGQRAELTLPDNTKIWLNAKSKIKYPVNFEKETREIELEGEAYFNVTQKKDHPFIVKTEKMEIEVLGTQFNVIDYPGQPTQEVSLLKGSVQLKANGITDKYLLKVNENIRIKEGKLYSSVITDHDYFKWKEGFLCFTNETVGDIIEKLQLYFDITIDVQKPGLLEHRYSGKFRTKDGVEQVLKVLQLENRFVYTKNNESNLITIK